LLDRGLPRPLAKTVLVLLFMSLCTAAPAAAQTVTGRIVGDTEAEPIRGALVTLIDAAGGRVRSVITNESGAFLIRVPAPGTYRLHAEMIGRRSVESEAFLAGETPVALTLALAYAPIELDGIQVKAASRCSTSAEAGRLTLRVWEEVRKALRAETVTREMATYEFEITRARRAFDPVTMRLLDKSEVTGKSVGVNPFRTLSASDIAEGGYARVVDGESRIYGPTTEILLSREFEETHCFSLKENRGKGLVGLVFKPVSGRKVTDIEGVLWMDSQTAELQRLEFKYRRVPSDLMPGQYSGFVDFYRLESGAWIIGRWKLTTPAVEEGAEVLALEPVQNRVTDVQDGTVRDGAADRNPDVAAPETTPERNGSQPVPRR
jgi:hypothetical protein